MNDAEQQFRGQSNAGRRPRRFRAVDDPPLHGSLTDILGEVEARAIRQALTDYDGNLTQVAHVLNISRTTLYAKMAKWGISFR